MKLLINGVKRDVRKRGKRWVLDCQQGGCRGEIVVSRRTKEYRCKLCGRLGVAEKIIKTPGKLTS